MKLTFRSIILLLMLSILTPGISYADSEPSPKTSYASEKRYNISVEPIILLVGFINLNMDFKISDNWTLGPSFSYWHTSVGSGDPVYTSDISMSVLALGIRGNWYASGVFSDGWYVSPVLQFINVKATTTSTGQDLSSSLSSVAVSGLAGYQWFWDSFNLKLGGGLSFATGPSKIHIESSNSTYSQDVSYNPTSLGLALDFMLGWTF